MLRREAEEIAVLLQLPIGLLMPGRIRSAPLTLSAEDVTDLAARVRIFGGSVDVAVRSLQVLERWVAFLADTGRWQGTPGEAENMRRTILRLGGDAEDAIHPAETLRLMAAEVSPSRLRQWSDSSLLACTGDALLDRVRAGGAGFGMLVTLDLNAVLASGTGGDGTAAIVLRGQICQVFRRVGVLRGSRWDVVQAGPNASAWERSGPAREQWCVEVGLAFLRAWHEQVALPDEEDAGEDQYDRVEFESPLASSLPVALLLVATGHAVVRPDHMEEDVRALLARVQQEYVGNDEAWLTEDSLLGLQALGLLRVEGDLLLVDEPWFPALSRFVDEHEDGLELRPPSATACGRRADTPTTAFADASQL